MDPVRSQGEAVGVTAPGGVTARLLSGLRGGDILGPPARCFPSQLCPLPILPTPGVGGPGVPASVWKRRASLLLCPRGARQVVRPPAWTLPWTVLVGEKPEPPHLASGRPRPPTQSQHWVSPGALERPRPDPGQSGRILLGQPRAAAAGEWPWGSWCASVVAVVDPLGASATEHPQSWAWSA